MEPSEDKDIVRIASDLCQRLRPGFLLVKSVSWKSRVPLGRGTVKLWSDECYFAGQSVILPESISGKLTPDEWAPIIASTIIFNYKLRPAIERHLVKQWGVGIFGPVCLIASIIWATRIIMISFAELLAIWYAVFFLVFGMSIFSSAPLRRHARLSADETAAGLLGKESFLKTFSRLTKIEPVDLAKLEPNRRSWMRYRDRPSISERIRNLQSSEIREIN